MESVASGALFRHLRAVGLLAGYHVRYQLLWLSFRAWGVLALAGYSSKIRLLPSKAFFDLAMACPLVAVRWIARRTHSSVERGLVPQKPQPFGSGHAQADPCRITHS
jgi:hypothetical protein